MPPKRRSTNKHLPQRVYQKHGAFYYVEPGGKWIRLANNLPEALSKWSALINRPQKIFTMGQLLDRYLQEVAPQKAYNTYKDNVRYIQNLKTAFGNRKPEEITAVHTYQYLDIRGETAKSVANREKEVLSHFFTMGVRWGVVQENPCRFVRSFPEKPRDRYIEDWGFTAVHTIASLLFKCLMDFAYLTALCRGDILSINLNQLTDEGIKIITSKTGAKLLIEWTPDLKQVVENIKQLKRTTRGLHLFCNRYGKPYTSRGTSAMWQRLMNKAMEQGVIQARFTFKDIRRKSASDIERLSSRENARKLLGHSTQRTTARYISGISKVKPVK